MVPVSPSADRRLSHVDFFQSFESFGPAVKFTELCRRHPLPREERIVFHERPHKYKVDGITVPRSATSLVHSYCPAPFDPANVLVSNVSVYACTSMVRAYDWFTHLLEMHLLEEDPRHSGVVACLFGRMQQHNRKIAASMCRRHYDRMFWMKGCPVGFAWDLRNANAEGFDSLKSIFDAGAVPAISSSSAGLAENTFEQKYGFPRLLRFNRAKLRRPTKIDWFRDVY